MKKLIIILLLVVFAFIFIGVTLNSGTGPEENTVSEKAKIRPEYLSKTSSLSFADYSGNEVKLSNYSGKIMVINSWAMWCPFCIKELSEFAAAQDEFGEDIVIIAINREESVVESKKFINNLGLTDELVFLIDEKDSFYRYIGGISMPETIFLDKEGKLVFHKRGPMNLKEIREKIQESVNTK